MDSLEERDVRTSAEPADTGELTEDDLEHVVGGLDRAWPPEDESFVLADDH